MAIDERIDTTTAGVKPGVTTAIRDGVATITIDQPDARVNVMNVQFIVEFGEAVAALPADLRGVIVQSGKPDQFVAGADLEMLLQATSAREAEEAARRLQRSLNRLAELPYPSVAVINGPALGGGLELALACDYRVCVQSDSNILGLPEVQLGLLPAGGGTQRLPRLIGLSRALGLILGAKRYNPRRAKRYGVVDEVVHAAVLQEAAARWLTKGKREGHGTWSRLDRFAAQSAPVRSFVYRQARKNVLKETRGHYPAPLRALDAVRAGQEQGFGAGLAAEAVAFGELAVTPVARNLIHLFFATEGLKREQRRLTKAAPPIERVGVLGAGFMGAGIAQAAAVAGYWTRLRDLKPEQVARGLKTARDLTRSATRRGRFSRTEGQNITNRLSGTTDWSGMERADLVIEAVFEDLEIKRQVIAELEHLVTADTIIASNTSSLPIALLAAEARHPDRIVGMHFFSPVHKMPLLEIIRPAASSERAVSTAVEAGRAMGKTIIVVGDGPGFYTTRVLGFMMQQAGSLFAEGASIEHIDRAMTSFGFPVGPMALMDEVGLEVAAHVSETLGSAFPDRFHAMSAVQRMIESGRLGKKGGKGFYDYTVKGYGPFASKKRPDPDVYALRDTASRTFPRDLIQRRLNLAFLNEAARCLEEGVLASPRDGDVGAIMGLGYPPFLGGPFRFADSTGISDVVEQLRQMEHAYGPGFAPAGILQDMAVENRTFYEDKQ